MASIRTSLTAKQWSTIDAVMDNVAANARITGEPSEARADSIREAGVAQLPLSRPWPPGDDLVSVTLPEEDWKFVLDSLEASEKINEELGLQESLTVVRSAREAVRSQLNSRPS